MTSEARNLLIVDRQVLFTDLLQSSLTTDEKFAVTVANDISSAIDYMKPGAGTKFDIVLLELDLAEPINVRSVAHMVKLSSPAKTVLFSRHAEQTFIESCVQRGAYGFVPKTISLNAFKSVLNFIASGQVFIPANLHSPPSAGGHHNAEILTAREMSVLGNMSLGLSNKEIAEGLGIQMSTVKMRVRSICKKLGATNRTQAVVNAQRQRLLPQH